MISQLLWWKKKAYPKFYLDYLSSLNIQLKQDFHLSRFAIIDTETTGLDVHKDQLLTIGGIIVQNNCISMNDTFYVQLPAYNREKKDEIAVHGVLPLKDLSLGHKEAMELFLAFVSGAIIVAHHTAFDVAMINRSLKEIGIGPLKNKTMDTFFLAQRAKHGPQYQQLQKDQDYSLDYLCEEYDIIPKNRHNAIGDAYLTSLLFMKLTHELRNRGIILLKDLLKR